MDTTQQIDAIRMVFDAVCPSLPGQLLLIPFIGPILAAVAGLVCSIGSNLLSLPSDVLMALGG